MSFYSKINTPATSANSENFSEFESADLFRDGLYAGTFAIPGSSEVVPVIIPVEKFGSVCVIDDGTHKDALVDFLQACAFRILSSVDPALCNFVLYDGVGLGRGLIALSDVDPRIKGEKILTSSSELTRALEKLSDRVVTVIQDILGSKFSNSSLVDYNKSAGEAGEPYYFLFLKDYPEGLSTEQCDLVERIVKSGPQAGVFTFMTFSDNHLPDNLPNSKAKSILKHTSNIVHYIDSSFMWQNIPDQETYNFFPFRLARTLPSSETRSRLFASISEKLDKAEDVTVNLASVLKEENLWSGDASSGIKVPIGKQNVSTIQYFRLADDINHALIGGSTGTGKSVLLHNIICNTAWLYSPEEVQMILLDYKEGTEFKVYEDLPHARVLSIQSEKEYGCSVFKFIDEEIRRRGEAFKAAGVQDIGSYNKLAGKKMPRMLVIIDEFQKLLDGDAKTAAYVSGAMEDVGRRGRSFGINLILSTQSLLNVNISSVQQSLGLRIILHLNTLFDCDRFLSDGNNVPYTTLTRPGQAVYNARAGLTEGNILFQTAFASRDELKKAVATMHEMAKMQYNGAPAPYTRFFYDGSCSADIRKNRALADFTTPNDRFATIFLGEPVALDENHVSYRLRRQNGSNVLIVGADEAAAFSIISFSTLQILNQSGPDAKIFIVDKTIDDSDFSGKLEEAFAPWPDKIKVTQWEEDAALYIEAIHAEMRDRRQNRSFGPRTILILYNIYEIRNLRKSGYTRPELTQKLSEIIQDGPGVGIHTFVYAASYNNLTQIFDIHDILPDFDVKIEICGGEGYRIFGSASISDKSQLPVKANGMGLLQINNSPDIVKFKLYRNNI